MAGIGIFAAGCLAITGLLLWGGGCRITSFAHGLWRRDLPRGLERNRKPPGVSGNGEIKKKLVVLATIALLGLGVALPTGLPLRYFLIWNSVKPAFEVYTQTYNAADIREIEVKTLNSMIIAEVGARPGGNEIRIVYEEPDWMRGKIYSQRQSAYFQRGVPRPVAIPGFCRQA